MELPQRLFDVIPHQLQHFPKTDMLAAKERGVWKTYSTASVQDIVRRFCSGLLQSGVKPGDTIAIISPNRPEWMFTDLACQQAGAVLVPIYPTISQSELEFILGDSGATLLFVDDGDLCAKVTAARPKLPALRDVFSFEPVEGVRHWSALTDLATAADYPRIESIKANITPDSLATIIYTSGTTGIPKGVMLTHRNIMSNVEGCLPVLPVNEQGRALSFLPLNHIFERMVTYVYLTAGVSVYYAENMESISDNLKEIRPGIFTTVPRLLEKVYERILSRGNALTGIQRRIFFWALGLAQSFEINRPQKPWIRIQRMLADYLVYRKWRQALGGQLQCIVTGAAACQVRLLKIFTAARIPILEGYGLTETSPVISVNRMPEKDRMFGTVGPVIHNVTVKLADDGEILCKGPNVTPGYYKRPDLTAEAIHDGWFHTGDIGVLVDGKFLRITDRKKELFKTSGGKFVAPQPIENKFRESPYIEQIMVVGSDRKFTGALIVPNFHNLEDWYEKQGEPFPGPAKATKDPKVRQLYKQSVEQYNQHFNQIEQVKRFELMDHEWTVNSGELTPTLKLKRKVIQEKYRAAIDRIYA